MVSKNDITTRVTTGPRSTVKRAPRKSACLIQFSGDALGRRYYMHGVDVVVGRSKTSGIIVQDNSVSRAHARLILDGDQVEIEDIGSSNGTYVNNRRIRSRRLLQDGDLLRLGLVHLKYLAKGNVENVFHDKMYRMATIDPGTQLYNRKYLLEALDSEFQFSLAQERPLAVIYYDLDFFKLVNDTYGHACGDLILRECATVAKACLRGDDILGRLGGEEFVVVLPNTNARAAARLAERIRKAIDVHKFNYEGKVLRQTVSMGVSEILPQFKSSKALLDDADQKLYQSKHGGRNRIVA